MFGFLKQRAAESAQNKLSRAQAHEIYTRVLIKAARNGRLTTGDEKELERVAGILEKLDDVEAELAELSAGFASISLADEWDESLKKYHDFTDARIKTSNAMQERHTAKLAEMQAGLDAERAAFLAKSDPELATIYAHSEACYVARKTAREFRIKFHELLGIEDPRIQEERDRPPIEMARDATAITGWRLSSSC